MPHEKHLHPSPCARSRPCVQGAGASRDSLVPGRREEQRINHPASFPLGWGNCKVCSTLSLGVPNGIVPQLPTQKPAHDCPYTGFLPFRISPPHTSSVCPKTTSQINSVPSSSWLRCNSEWPPCGQKQALASCSPHTLGVAGPRSKPRLTPHSAALPLPVPALTPVKPRVREHECQGIGFFSPSREERIHVPGEV